MQGYTCILFSIGPRKNPSSGLLVWSKYPQQPLSQCRWHITPSPSISGHVQPPESRLRKRARPSPIPPFRWLKVDGAAGTWVTSGARGSQGAGGGHGQVTRRREPGCLDWEGQACMLPLNLLPPGTGPGPESLMKWFAARCEPAPRASRYCPRDELALRGEKTARKVPRRRTRGRGPMRNGGGGGGAAAFTSDFLSPAPLGPPVFTSVFREPRRIFRSLHPSRLYDSNPLFSYPWEWLRGPHAAPGRGLCFSASAPGHALPSARNPDPSLKPSLEGHEAFLSQTRWVSLFS